MIKSHTGGLHIFEKKSWTFQQKSININGRKHLRHIPIVSPALFLDLENSF
jgi:hypothetical protein